MLWILVYRKRKKISYDSGGPDSDNPLAFKAYDENRVVGDKTIQRSGPD